MSFSSYVACKSFTVQHTTDPGLSLMSNIQKNGHTFDLKRWQPAENLKYHAGYAGNGWNESETYAFYTHSKKCNCAVNKLGEHISEGRGNKAWIAVAVAIAALVAVAFVARFGSCIPMSTAGAKAFVAATTISLGLVGASYFLNRSSCRNDEDEELSMTPFDFRDYGSQADSGPLTPTDTDDAARRTSSVDHLSLPEGEDEELHKPTTPGSWPAELEPVVPPQNNPTSFYQEPELD